MPFTLSASEAAVFQRLQNNALLPTLVTPGVGQLVALFKEKRKEEERSKMEPYADFLELELGQMLTERKDSILTQLRDSKDTSFRVSLFSWNTVLYSESLSDFTRRVNDMTADQKSDYTHELRRRTYQIEDMGWESMFGVETTRVSSWNPETDETYFSYYPVKVDRIIRNSDLAERLSLTLGPNFYPSIHWELVKSAEGEFGYSVYKKTLCVRYFPFGVSRAQITKLLSVATQQTERAYRGEKITRFESFTRGVGHEGLCVLPEPEDMPPLEPAPIRAPPTCFCGCVEDSE